MSNPRLEAVGSRWVALFLLGALPACFSAPGAASASSAGAGASSHSATSTTGAASGTGTSLVSSSGSGSGSSSGGGSQGTTGLSGCTQGTGTSVASCGQCDPAVELCTDPPSCLDTCTSCGCLHITVAIPDAGYLPADLRLPSATCASLCSTRPDGGDYSVSECHFEYDGALNPVSDSNGAKLLSCTWIEAQPVCGPGDLPCQHCSPETDLCLVATGECAHLCAQCACTFNETTVSDAGTLSDGGELSPDVCATTCVAPQGVQSTLIGCHLEVLPDAGARTCGSEEVISCAWRHGGLCE